MKDRSKKPLQSKRDTYSSLLNDTSSGENLC